MMEFLLLILHAIPDRLGSLTFTTRACKTKETDPLPCQTVLTLRLQQGSQQRAAATSQKPQWKSRQSRKSPRTFRLMWLMRLMPGSGSFCYLSSFSPDSWQAIGVLTSQRWGLRRRTFEACCSTGCCAGCCPDCGGEVWERCCAGCCAGCCARFCGCCSDSGGEVWQRCCAGCCARCCSDSSGEVWQRCCAGCCAGCCPDCGGEVW